MHFLMQQDILASWPVIHLERGSVRGKLIPYFSLFGSIFKYSCGYWNRCQLREAAAWAGCLMGLHSLLDGIKTLPTCFIHGKRINHFNSLSRIQSAQHESMLFPTTFSGPHYSFLRLASTSFTNSLYFPSLFSFHHNLFLGNPRLPLCFNVHLCFIVHRPSAPDSPVTLSQHIPTVHGAWGPCTTPVKSAFLMWRRHLHTTELLGDTHSHPRQSWGHSSTSVPMLTSHVT